MLACNVDIRNHILNKHCAITITYKGAIVNASGYDIAFNTKVADGSATYEAEKAAIIVAEIVAVSNGMPLSVECAAERIVFRTNHKIGIIAICQIDVGSQNSIRLLATLNEFGKGIQIFSCGNLHLSHC